MNEQAQFSFTGVELKRQALDAFEGSPWLIQGRRVARELCLKNGSVTSDDVIAEIGLPEHQHHNVIGALFHKGFYISGYTHTTRRIGHARRIARWKLAR